MSNLVLGVVLCLCIRHDSKRSSFKGRCLLFRKRTTKRRARDLVEGHHKNLHETVTVRLLGMGTTEDERTNIETNERTYLHATPWTALEDNELRNSCKASATGRGERFTPPPLLGVRFCPSRQRASVGFDLETTRSSASNRV